MNDTKSHAEMVARRAEVIAELFLEDLSPLFIARPASGIGFDLLVGFANEHGGVNLTAVEIKSTERAVNDRFSLPKKVFDRLAHSNIPCLLLVVDVKHNQIYFAWPSPEVANAAHGGTVTLRLEEVDTGKQRDLRHRLQGARAA